MNAIVFAAATLVAAFMSGVVVSRRRGAAQRVPVRAERHTPVRRYPR